METRFADLTDELVAGAANLLETRHARLRAAESLIVEDDPPAAIRSLLSDGASGYVAIRGDDVVGFVIAEIGDHLFFDRFAWVERPGYAATDAETLRDMYAFAAERWVQAGAMRHFVLVPHLMEDLDPWFRLGFGPMHVGAIRESGGPGAPMPPGLTIRLGSVDDLDEAIEIDGLIRETQERSPSFAILPERPADEIRADWLETLLDEDAAYFVAERGGRVVGHATLYPLPDFGDPHDAIFLASTATLPDVRGEGIGLCLTDHALDWAAQAGYRAVVTNWRVTNLVASRFWPARGFRPTFLRLHRVIGIG